MINSMSATTAAAPPHRLQDDLQGLATGTLFVALGVHLFQHAGLVPGGTVGLALLLHQATGLPLSWALVGVNLPFYWLAWRQLGRAFALRTLVSVAALSFLVGWLPQGLELRHVAGPVAAVLGGLLCGAGMLMLFRHQASLGGLNVLALYLHNRLGWPAGRVQMALDAVIVCTGGLVAGSVASLAWSVLAVVALNLALVFNHRPGRYVA